MNTLPYPTVDGPIAFTKNWSINLPETFYRRIEDKSLVLWNGNYTIWIDAYNNDLNKKPEEQIAAIKSNKSPLGQDVIDIPEGEVYRFGYSLDEKRDDKTVCGFYGFTASKNGCVQTAFYFQKEELRESVYAIWKSINAIE